MAAPASGSCECRVKLRCGSAAAAVPSKIGAVRDASAEECGVARGRETKKRGLRSDEATR